MAIGVSAGSPHPCPVLVRALRLAVGLLFLALGSSRIAAAASAQSGRSCPWGTNGGSVQYRPAASCGGRLMRKGCTVQGTLDEAG